MDTYDSQGQPKQNEQTQEVELEPPNYTPKEELAFSRYVRELNHAWDQRQQTYTELDDMTVDQWYIANKKAAAGYIQPKKNRRDVRTVSGTTREKSNTLLSTILKYTFNHSVEAFDEEEIPDVALGTGLTDLITKSRLLECPRYDSKRPMILKEIVDQGTIFVREVYNEHYVINKKMEEVSWDDMMKSKWTENVEIQERYCDTQLLPLYSVFLGNIREFNLEKQPYVGVVRRLTWSEADSLYKKWPRFKNVPKKVKHTITGTLSQNSMPYEGFQMTEVGLDMVEEITYYNKWTNEYQIFLNGVMMLPVGFPLQFLTGRIEYPISKGDLEPISHNFAYSRGISAKTKFNQALMDEMFRAIILKTRKSYAPPIANNSGRILSKRIFDPGTVHNGVDPQKIQQIGENNGVTGPEMNTIQFIKQIIDESSINPLFEGQRSPGEQTAKEISELQKQSLMRLGVSIIGIINLETEMVWKRLWNIIRNWTEQTDVKITKNRGKALKASKYRTETVESEFEDGTKGQRIIEMKKGPFPHPKQIMAEEELLTLQKGLPIRKMYIDPEKLRNIKYRFFIKVTPTEKDQSDLKAIIFEESMMKAMQMFPESVNREYVKQQWAIHQKLDPDKLFIKNQQQPGAEVQGEATLGAQTLPQAPRKPGLKNLMQTA